jgi:branched-chain amino acid transport system permease protein
MTDFFLTYSNLIISVGINILFALSVFITLKAGLMNFGNAGFAAIGAYTSAILTTKYDWPFFPALLVACLFVFVIAFAMGSPVLKLKGVYFAIATVAFTAAIQALMMNLTITGGAMGIGGIPVAVSKTILFIIVGVIIYFCYRFNKSRIGKTLEGIGVDELAVKSLGINTKKFKLYSFIASALIAAIAGGLSAHMTRLISPNDFSFHHSISMLLFTIFGGVKIVWGPVLGASVLTALPELFRFLDTYRDIAYGLILLVVIIYLPNGVLSLFGKGLSLLELSKKKRGEINRDA